MLKVPVGRQPAAPLPIDVDLRVEDLFLAEREVVVVRPIAQPIFVIGDRSGHLGALLDAHRTISFTPGPGLLPGFVRVVSDNRAALARYGYPEQYWLQSIARYYDGLQRDHAAARGRVRWAAPAPADDIGFVDRLYPRCQILHVTGDRGGDRRDRRPAVTSQRARLAGRRLLTGRYLEVPHADLRADPEGTLRTILGFLGEDWDPALPGARTEPDPRKLEMEVTGRCSFRARRALHSSQVHEGAPERARWVRKMRRIPARSQVVEQVSRHDAKRRRSARKRPKFNKS